MFRVWVLPKAASAATLWLAQRIEHQTMDLAVAGSTPAPPAVETRLADAKASATKGPRGRANEGLLPAWCMFDRVRLALPVAHNSASRVRNNTLAVPCSAQIPPVRIPGNDQPTTELACEHLLNRRFRKREINALHSAGSSVTPHTVVGPKLRLAPNGFFCERAAMNEAQSRFD